MLNKYNIQILVAPGNHDIGFGDNAKKDIFNKFFNENFPYTPNNNSNIIIEDSTSNNWLIDDETFKIANLNEKRKFIIRHHIPISELKYIANSLEGVSDNLPDIKSLASRFKYETYIISGDTGGVEKMPRVVCQKFGKIIVVANGLGEVDDDKIIIISKNKPYLFNL